MHHVIYKTLQLGLVAIAILTNAMCNLRSSLSTIQDNCQTSNAIMLVRSWYCIFYKAAKLRVNQDLTILVAA